MKTSTNRKFPSISVTESLRQEKIISNNIKFKENLLCVKDDKKTASSSPNELRKENKNSVSPRIEDTSYVTNKSLLSTETCLSPAKFKNKTKNIFKENFKKPKKICVIRVLR